MIYYKLVTICLFFCFINCSPKSTSTKNKIIEIDMKQSEKGDFDNLINNISCLYLKDSSDIQSLKFCKRIIEYGEFFYLMTTSEVLIYNNLGFLQKKISFGPEIFFLSTFIIEPLSKELWIIGNNNILHKYKLDGTLIDKKILSFSCVDMINVDKNIYLVYDGRFNRKWNYYFSITDFVNFYDFFLPKEKVDYDQYIPESMFAAHRNTNDIFILMDKRDSIYRYSPKSNEMIPYYWLNFHDKFLTENAYPEKGFSDEQMAKIIQEKKYILSIYSFYLVSDKLLFKLSGKETDLCVINLKDNSLKTFDKLFDGFNAYIHNPFIGANENSLYCILKEEDILNHYKNISSSYKAITEILPSLNRGARGSILVKIEINKDI